MQREINSVHQTQPLIFTNWDAGSLFFPFVLFSFFLFLFFCLFDWTEVIALILFKKWLLHTPWQSHQLASLTIIYKNKCEKVPALL